AAPDENGHHPRSVIAVPHPMPAHDEMDAKHNVAALFSGLTQRSFACRVAIVADERQARPGPVCHIAALGGPWSAKDGPCFDGSDTALGVEGGCTNRFVTERGRRRGGGIRRVG